MSLATANLAKTSYCSRNSWPFAKYRRCCDISLPTAVNNIYIKFEGLHGTRPSFYRSDAVVWSRRHKTNEQTWEKRRQNLKDNPPRCHQCHLLAMIYLYENINHRIRHLAYAKKQLRHPTYLSTVKSYHMMQRIINLWLKTIYFSHSISTERHDSISCRVILGISSHEYIGRLHRKNG